jgi:hypothetical protein
MSADRDIRDANRHRNLERLAGVLSLPARADAERQARWRSVPLPSAPWQAEKTVSLTTRYIHFALASSGVAAVIAVVIWLSVGHVNAVSAATILTDFKIALAKSLAIRIEGLDLGSVAAKGDILLDRAGPGAADDTQYAEVHVVLKSDNREWGDVDTVLVMCQSPGETWRFVRGDSAGGWQPGQTVPSETLIRGRAWRDFASMPLDQFGPIPLQMDFDYNDSKANYHFHAQQRVLVEQLLRLLLELSATETAEQVVEDLRRSAGQVHLEQVDPTTYVLRASQFVRLGSLDLGEPQVPDVSEFVKQYVIEIRYDSTLRRIVGRSGWNPPGLSETGVRIDSDLRKLDLPVEDPEKLVAHFRARAMDVQVDRCGDGQWIIRVTGYPFPLDTSGFDWLGEFVTRLRASLTLSIYYDAPSHAVRKAEFRGLGSPDGRITLDLGPVPIDPERLRAEHWITSRTQIRTP